MSLIDLNSDLGEGYGPYRIADDEALLGMVTSANIACGFHAGDPDVMDQTIRTAISKGVAIGAHIGYPDLKHFGRRAMNFSLRELRNLTCYQLGALKALTQAAGGRVEHANFHGALGNLSFSDSEVAKTLIDALMSVDEQLKFIGLAHTEAVKAAEDAGMEVVYSFLADRAYMPDGKLVSRQQPGAVIKDKDEIAERVHQVVSQGQLCAYDGSVIEMPARSILIHSDTAGAMQLAKVIHDAVIEAGGSIQRYNS